MIGHFSGLDLDSSFA